MKDTYFVEQYFAQKKLEKQTQWEKFLGMIGAAVLVSAVIVWAIAR